MDLVLTVHVPGAEPVRREVGGAITAGGSRADGLLIPGAPPRALRLLPVVAGIVVEANAAGVRVAGHAVHPGARRLLRPGERAELAGATLALEPIPVPEATRAAASPVLRGEVGDGSAVLVLTGARAGARHAVGTGLTVGRGRAATLRIPDPLASRVHLRLRSGPAGATVEDLGSKNGVRVNGVKVERRPCALRPGDEIALGETLLCFEDPWPGGAPEGTPPPAAAAASPSRARASLRKAIAAALLLALSAASLALAGS